MSNNGKRLEKWTWLRADGYRFEVVFFFNKRVKLKVFSRHKHILNDMKFT